MRSSMAGLQSSPEERCGVRDFEEPLEGEGRLALLAFSRASRACFMRSSMAFLQSSPEERCGVRDFEEPLEGELLD